jgi:hypothetical protein
MIAAGVSRMQDLSGEMDASYRAEAIYLAMEYQRLEELGKLIRLANHNSQVSDR